MAAPEAAIIDGVTVLCSPGLAKPRAAHLHCSLMLQSILWRSLRLCVTVAAWAGAAAAMAQTTLPAPVEAALARAKIPRDAVSMYVVPVEPQRPPRLAWQIRQPMNPASVMKLVTTYAALEQLGPSYVWRTPVYLDGVRERDSFRGTVYIQGSGDPKLVSERLWLMLGRLQGMGIHTIEGDIVIDRSAFQVPQHDAAAFDGEPFKPYNAGPDALLVNYKTQVLGFIPDPAAGVAHIHYELPLAGIQAPRSVPLAPQGTACGNWRALLQADWSDPQRIQLSGQYPASCGDKNWAVALPDPHSFALKAVAGMWQSMGGTLSGSVRAGVVPAGLPPAWDNVSPALAEVVRDINKYSNNVMTQQVLLTMGKERFGSGSLETGRQALAQWWQSRWPAAEMPVVDNGAGLSRQARISAQALGRMLQTAWASSVMPELVASLPISGMDGTLRRSKASASAHLKTGSLNEVNTLAGYVHGNSGQRYVLVAMVNHPNAGAARPVMDALVDWAAQD